ETGTRDERSYAAADKEEVRPISEPPYPYWCVPGPYEPCDLSGQPSEQADPLSFAGLRSLADGQHVAERAMPRLHPALVPGTLQLLAAALQLCAHLAGLVDVLTRGEAVPPEHLHALRAVLAALPRPPTAEQLRWLVEHVYPAEADP